jgi:hypothetical protein
MGFFAAFAAFLFAIQERVGGAKLVGRRRDAETVAAT